MKVWIFLFLWVFCSKAYTNELDELWQNALSSSEDSQVTVWKQWIDSASALQTQSAASYLNYAGALWKDKKVSAAVENLLLASQLRNLPWDSWLDWNLVSQIQQSLLTQPSPIDNLTLRLAFLWERFFLGWWLTLLMWTLAIFIFNRYGRRNGKWPGLPGGLFFTFLLVVGIGLEVNQQIASRPLILVDDQEVINVYQNPQVDQSKKIADLPPGLLIISQSEKDDFVEIHHPIKGWIPKELTVPFPKPAS